MKIVAIQPGSCSRHLTYAGRLPACLPAAAQSHSAEQHCRCCSRRHDPCGWPFASQEPYFCCAECAGVELLPCSACVGVLRVSRPPDCCISCAFVLVPPAQCARLLGRRQLDLPGGHPEAGAKSAGEQGEAAAGEMAGQAIEASRHCCEQCDQCCRMWPACLPACLLRLSWVSAQYSKQAWFSRVWLLTAWRS